MGSTPQALTLLAHAGGWDEALIFLGPVIVYLVIRRMGRQEPPGDDLTRPDEPGPAPTEEPGDDPSA